MVVGAAQGLGAEFCRQLAARGLNLVMVALDDDELLTLASRLESEHGVRVRTVAGDVTRAEVLARLAAATTGLEVGLLVHNAALASRTPFLDTPIDVHLAAVRLNVTVPLRLIDRFVPAMTRRGRGGVILLGSLAGLHGTPLLATYSATKAFIVTLAEALWDEWRPSGVDVIALIPGPTDTPGYRASAPRRTRFTPPPMPPTPVVTAALAAIGTRPWTIAGRTNRFTGFLLTRVLPRRVAVRLTGRTMRTMFGPR